jgi:RNA polymerase sigma-70 factor (ECF subfamily)
MSDVLHDAPDCGAAAIDWPAVWEQHGRWLRTVVLARVGAPDAVDDVMQDLAAAVFKSGTRLRDHQKLAPWLYRLAVTTALQYRRRQGRRRKLAERYADRWQPADGSSSTADPLGWLLAEEQRELVRLALKNLARRDAEILLLKYTESWTYHQLAEHLGASPGAVESRLHRARAKMRGALASLDPSFSRSSR